MPSEIARPEPTTPVYEEWEVVVGKDKFHLKGEQVVALKKEIAGGKRGVVWFKEFAISIPHIQCAYKINGVKKTIDSRLPGYSSLTKEERERSNAKLDEIRKKFFKGHLVNGRTKAKNT